MTNKVDYHAMSLEALQEAHSRLCGEAYDSGVTIPEALTVDFDTADAGAEICTELSSLLNNGLAKAGAPVVEVPRQKTKKASRGAATSGESEMTDTTTAATAKPKAAKKATKKPAKKATKKPAKKVAKKTAAKKPRSGDNKTAGVLALMRRAKGVTRAEVLELTGWKAVSMQQVAENAGVKLVVDESERPFKYKIKE
jgi:hypothetical protein